MCLIDLVNHCSNHRTNTSILLGKLSKDLIKLLEIPFFFFFIFAIWSLLLFLFLLLIISSTSCRLKLQSAILLSCSSRGFSLCPWLTFSSSCSFGLFSSNFSLFFLLFKLTLFFPFALFLFSLFLHWIFRVRPQRYSLYLLPDLPILLQILASLFNFTPKASDKLLDHPLFTFLNDFILLFTDGRIWPKELDTLHLAHSDFRIS